MLLQGDCIDVLQRIKSQAVQCVFADPPFNLGKEYGNGFSKRHDSIADDDYVWWSKKWIDECVRVIEPGGAIFLYTIPRWGYLFAEHLELRQMSFRHWIALSMKGTFPRGRRLYPAHYALLYFTKGEPRVFNKIRVPVPACRHCGKDIKDYGGHRKYLNPEGLNLTDFWEDTSPNRHRSSKARPGVNELKPLIPQRAIQISTSPGDIVLDPFGGGGSTYQEAQRLDRFWLGIEIGDCQAIESRFMSFDPLTIGLDPPKAVTSIIERD
jgi:site-specific DNA-methyltransferase (adenine-specific)